MNNFIQLNLQLFKINLNFLNIFQFVNNLTIRLPTPNPDKLLDGEHSSLVNSFYVKSVGILWIMKYLQRNSKKLEDFNFLVNIVMKYRLCRPSIEKSPI